MAKLFVARGSIYNPGIHVVEEYAPRQQRVIASNFAERAEAEEYLAFLQSEE